MTDDQAEAGIEFELVAASLRSNTGDAKAYLSALAVKLSGALPQQTQLSYAGGLFSKKTVSEIAVDLGELRFHLKEDHGRLTPSRQKIVRGIVLKSEPVQLDAWIDELSASVTQQADESESARASLQQMLENS